ncbi:MAG: retroviral-like aspartic protease family protein [Gammaproteobacteria bacterium]
MTDRGLETYYVQARFAEGVPQPLMVDTGSGYATINENTLEQIRAVKGAVYVKNLAGIMADGSEMALPVYRVSRLDIGCCCTVRDVEVAVFPGSTRQILGLSALKNVAPFALSLDPPSLTLSHCEVEPRSSTSSDPLSAGHTRAKSDTRPNASGLIKTASPSP